jgi:hypothetical protein
MEEDILSLLLVAPKSRGVGYAPLALGNAETWTQEGQQTMVPACVYVYVYTHVSVLVGCV